MRIIGGSLGGLKLASWKSSEKFNIRPMTDSARETLFNVLQPYLHKDVLFLDLFSGSGSLSMEAISRGVREAHCVESHNLSIEIIKKNKQLLARPKKLIIHRKDVFHFLKDSRVGPFHIIVADPPFPLHWGEKILEAIVKSHLYIIGTIFIVETSKNEELKESYSCFYLFSKKDFSDKKMWFYEAKK